MKAIGYYNGETGPLDEMRVPMNDRVCYFGDGVYDATSCHRFTPFALDEHIERIYRSAAMLRISVGLAKSAMKEALLKMAASIEDGDSQLYWQLTRGTAPRSHAFPKDVDRANFWITCRPFHVRDVQKRYDLITVPDTRYYHCNIKTLNLIPNVMASQRAAEQGCEEAIFHRGDFVTECSHSNIHIIEGGGLRTAPLNQLILPGITRGHVLELCDMLDIPTIEQAFTVDEMMAADEVLFTSASAYCCAVKSINGTPVGGKAPEIVERLQEAYARKVEADIAAAPNPFVQA